MLQQYLNMGFTYITDLQVESKHRDLGCAFKENVQSPIKEQSQSQILRELSFDVLTPDQRLRQKGKPVGLKNLANVCYLNSLIQTYFHNPIFVKEILSFKYPVQLNFEDLLNKNEAKAKRIKSSIDLVVHLQRLFAYLVHTDRKYVDPYRVFLNVVDEFGNRFQLGDQKDWAEFNLQFITCIDEGLKYHENKIMDAEIQNKDESGDMHESDQYQNEKNKSGTTLTRSMILLDENKAKLIEQQPLQSQPQNQTIINRLFFGKTKEYITHPNQRNQSEEQEQIFLQIILNVKNRSLYQAWEANNSFLIEGYRNGSEVIEVAEKTIWITQIPDSLLFQIQRVGYDPERGLIKMNDEFRFEKEIYADRFLLENRQKVIETQQQLNELKIEQAKLLFQMDKYQNLGGISMLTILNTATKYVKEVKPDDEIMQQRIEQCRLSIQMILQKFQFQLDEINQKIEDLYAIMKKYKYFLQSILIHEGAAESGHYYTYIYNPFLKHWFKFNDINVTQVSEEKVLRDAYGDGKSKTNAYCLIYQRSDHFEPQSYSDYTNNSVYAQYIQQNLYEEVTNDNKKFSIEQKEYELVELGDLVVEIYNVQFQQVNEMARKFKNRNGNPLNNFPTYLRTLLDQMNDLVKWSILDYAIREASQGKRNLRDYQEQLIFQQRCISIILILESNTILNN
ncbi:unnamed protein product (macronuclear) [Paramecium tetraurelia]|uniref:Ubiquitin carboxyl-terminal hydrolase n=1 Tax=Paramecium tetraurelia TaxID=5888 RepID=A0C8R6_PARTE|nr:uncharacterized protein GSPATT00036318001 [Paramecium tetraurelia]CAK67183.1 unnamed protein product [Paramecium tetraurelia]|eukprot:XP_001434580.1 hypothetical protein (macronuclear) [Paramecium tetraurelia strain d4-2]